MVHPTPRRPGRLWHLIEVAPKTIENRPVGSERRPAYVETY